MHDTQGWRCVPASRQSDRIPGFAETSVFTLSPEQSQSARQRLVIFNGATGGKRARARSAAQRKVVLAQFTEIESGRNREVSKVDGHPIARQPLCS
jgi:hypothetical protein